MDIYQLADKLGEELVFTRHPNENRFTCSFQYSGVKQKKTDAGTSSIYGAGESPLAALGDYVRRIRGRVLVIYRATPTKMVMVPKKLAVPRNLSDEH